MITRVISKSDEKFGYDSVMRHLQAPSRMPDMFSAYTTLEKFKQYVSGHFGFGQGDNRVLIVLKKLHFKSVFSPYGNANSSGLKGVFR